MFDPRNLEFKLSSSKTVDNLMEACEDMFYDAAQRAGIDVELVVNVLWNQRDPKKALNPSEPLALHFQNDDTFGVHGDIVPLEEEAEMPEESKIPIMILTGFLGAGKTTLLNYILQQQREKKIAVIENEFGEVAIDDALLQQDKLAIAEKVVLMDNGCMCCTVRGDLQAGLMTILEASRREESSIDALIIETTGMADPVPIVRTIKQTPEVMTFFRLDGVITVADAKHLPGRLNEKVEAGKVNEAYQQVAFADRVLLNKIDLVEAEQVMQVKESIRKINRLARVISSVRGEIKLSDIMGLNAHSLLHFRDEDFMEIDGLPTTSVARPKKGAMNIMSGSFGGFSSKSNTPSRHSSTVASFSIVRQGEISDKLLCRFLGVLQNPPPEKGLVFRFKAILAVEGYAKKLAVHAVQDVVEHDYLEKWEEGEPRVCKMVFIGKHLDEAYFRMVFEKVTTSL